jgi:hypothetical protein
MLASMKHGSNDNRLLSCVNFLFLFFHFFFFLFFLNIRNPGPGKVIPLANVEEVYANYD